MSRPCRHKDNSRGMSTRKRLPPIEVPCKKSSNPASSSGESTNFRFLLMRACSPGRWSASDQIDRPRRMSCRDNKHMDFRLSIMKVHDDSPSVVVSTLCMVHNKFGQYYLSLITPFHKFGLRRLMASALAAGQRSLVRPMDLGLKRIAFSSVVGVTGAAVAAGGQAESATNRSISAKNSMKSPGRTGLAFIKY